MKISSNNKYYLKACKRESQFRDWDFEYITNLPKDVNLYQNVKKHWNENIDDFWYLKSLWYFEKWLSIWSWGGIFELNLIKSWVVGEFTFLDISKKAHETLRKNAIDLWIEDKIKTDIQDFNFLKLENNSYDIVSCQNILHHLINLEDALYEINKSLKPDWIFVVDDFIGEKKMYRSDTKMKMIEMIKVFLKEKYNVETNTFIRTNPKVLTNNCPFECVRSDELYKILKYYFGENIVKESLFWHIFSNWWWIIKDYNPIFFDVLRLFDDFAAKNNLVSPSRIFGVYKKSNKWLLKSENRTKQEIRENIKVSIINENFLMKFGNNISKKSPWITSILKRIYFMLRK